MTLPQSDTVRLPCSRHHFNCAPLDWTDRETQTQGTRAYSPLICYLRRTVAADIALPKDAVTIDVTRVEVSLRFRLATIAIYRSSAGVVTLERQPKGLQTIVCVFWNCFHKHEITELLTPKKSATSVIDCPASMRPTARQRLESSIRFLEVIETRMS
ncbi:uncharacterized protein TNCV_4751571 [Trichonephila clavipes]|nr:uncharacterized protein TNCV_4751571 [Trichonephila clavipes]